MNTQCKLPSVLLFARAILSIHKDVDSRDLSAEKLCWLLYFFLRDHVARTQEFPFWTRIQCDDVTIFIPAVMRNFKTLRARLTRSVAPYLPRLTQVYYRYGALARWRMREIYYTMPSFWSCVLSQARRPVSPQKLTQEHLRQDAKTVTQDTFKPLDPPIVYQRICARRAAMRGQRYRICYQKAEMIGNNPN